MKDLLTSCYLLASEYYLLSPRLWRRTRERPRGKWVMTIAKEINSTIFLCSTHAGLCVPAFSLVFTNRGLRIGSPPKRAGLVIFLSRGEGAWVTQGSAKKNQNTEVYCGIHESVGKKTWRTKFLSESVIFLIKTCRRVSCKR